MRTKSSNTSEWKIHCLVPVLLHLILSQDHFTFHLQNKYLSTNRRSIWSFALLREENLILRCCTNIYPNKQTRFTSGICGSTQRIPKTPHTWKNSPNKMSGLKLSNFPIMTASFGGTSSSSGKLTVRRIKYISELMTILCGCRKISLTKCSKPE